MNRVQHFENYKPVDSNKPTYNLIDIHVKHFVNRTDHRIQSLDDPYPDKSTVNRGRSIRPTRIQTTSSNGHTQNIIRYDPQGQTVYSEPFESVETMMIEFTDMDEILPLVRHLFATEIYVNRSIVIVGPCRLKFPMEQYLDIFLSHNRVWKIETQSNEICDFGDTSDHYGILSLLTMVEPTKYKFFKELDALQFLTSNWRKIYQPEISLSNDAKCTNTKVLVATLKDSGMMSSIHHGAYVLTQSMLMNRMYIPEEGIFQYAYHWEELYLPSSSCLLGDVIDLRYPREPIQSINKKSLTNPIDPSIRVSRMTSKRVGREFLPYSQIPSGYFDNGLQFRGHVMGYLLRQSTVLRKIVHDIKKDMFGSQKMPRCVSLHVRNGDKQEEAESHTLDFYMDRVSSHDVGFEYSDIFIMSDNATVLLDSTLAAYPKYKFHKINLERYSGTESAADRLVAGRGNKFESGATVAAEVTLATECDYFFGTLSSNVGRAIIELMVAANPNINKVNWLSLDGSGWVNKP
eukprot:gene11511-13430_t